MTELEFRKLVCYEKKARYLLDTFFTEKEQKEYRCLMRKYIESNADKFYDLLFSVPDVD